MKKIAILIFAIGSLASCRKSPVAPATQAIQDSFPLSTFPKITLVANGTSAPWLHFHSDVGLSFVGNIPNNCNIALLGIKDTTIMPPPAGSPPSWSLYPLERGSWVQDIDGRTFFYKP